MTFKFVAAPIRRPRKQAVDQSPILIVIIINLLFILSVAFNATHPAPVQSLDSVVAAGL